MIDPALGGRPSVPRGVARLAGAVACLLLAGCDGTSPEPEAVPFGRRGEVRIEVLTPLPVTPTIALEGGLEQRLVWRSEGPWQLTERILYRNFEGDRTVRRSTDDPETLARRYARWIAGVNDSSGLQLFLGEGLSPSLRPSCSVEQSRVTVQIVDAERADSVAWTRCGNGAGLISLTAPDPTAPAARVIEAVKRVRDATLPLDSSGYAYTASRPFGTIDKGEKASVPLLLPRVIEDAPSWAAFWLQHKGPAVLLPQIDFTRELVLIAAVGTRPEAGDSVEVRRILPIGFATQISLVEQRPGDFCTPAPRPHAPFHIVVAPADMPRPIFFSVDQELVTCR